MGKYNFLDLYGNNEENAISLMAMISNKLKKILSFIIKSKHKKF